jgi:Domain of Unknown Function (DUF1080)
MKFSQALRFIALLLLPLCAALVPASAAFAIDTDKPSAKPPKDAIVLFDGTDLSNWVGAHGKPAAWNVMDGYMEVAPQKGDIRTKQVFGPDFQVHVEFWLPLMPDAHGQARANSGVYLQGRHEIQVLDSYQNDTYANGVCGALYGVIAPTKNASKPPEQWQTFDITFHAPRVDEQGKVTQKGRVTVVQNGETIIDNGEFDRSADLGKDPKIGAPGPILLQDHGCKVRFRNIWLRPITEK